MKFTDYKCLESLLIVTEGIETPNDQIKNNIPLIKSITSKIIEQTKEKYKALQFNCVIKNSNNIVYFDVFRDQNILNENNEKYKEASGCGSGCGRYCHHRKPEEEGQRLIPSPI